MTRKVQRRFMLTSLTAISIILLMLVVCIGIFDYHKMLGRLDQHLHSVEAQYLAFGKAEFPREALISASGLPLFWVAEFDKAGECVYLSEVPEKSNRNMVEQITEAVSAQSKDIGFCEECRFQKKNTADGSRIIFVEASRSLTQFHDSVRNLIMLALIAWGVSWLIMFRMARWMVRPYEEAYESQKRFVSNISHDLKTPLTVIRADADVLKGIYPEDRWINDIHMQSGKMSELIEEMLLLSRLQEKENQMTWVDFPISDIVEEEAQLFVQMAEIKKKKYFYEVQPMLTYHGEPKAIRQVTGILLDNAIRYSDDNGIIRLKLIMKGNRIILTVYNTVTHISRKELPRLTERFYRSDTARNTETNSHGIGLPAVEEIVRAHHGELILSTEDEQSFLVTIKL